MRFAQDTKDHFVLCARLPFVLMETIKHQLTNPFTDVIVDRLQV